MKKLKISGVVQGIILMSIGLVCDVTLIIMLLIYFKSESTLFLIVFSVLLVFILFTLNQLIEEYKHEKK